MEFHSKQKKQNNANKQEYILYYKFFKVATFAVIDSFPHCWQFLQSDLGGY